jgi:hypothetical protein
MSRLPPSPPADADVPAHARTWALIPWLVNGSADAADRAAVEQHLAACAECRAELVAQQRLRDGVRAHGPAPAAALDAEPGLQRLLRRLDQLPAEQEVSAPAVPAAHAPPAPSPAVPLAVGAAAAPGRRGGRLPTALAAAVVAQAVGLALLSLQLLRGDDSSYRTLSQPTAAPAAGYLVVPEPALPMQRWQALLDETRLRVVDGPNAAGAYTLAPRGAPAGAPAAVLARLRAAPGVRLAEALGPP